MTYRLMWCGELQGTLQPVHLDFRAKRVRYSIAEMFGIAYEPLHKRTPSQSRAWRSARKHGWRVVKVKIIRP